MKHKKDRLIKVIIWLTFLLLLALFIIVVVNPHYEKRQVFTKVVLSDSWFPPGFANIIEYIGDDKCLCDNNVWSYDYNTKLIVEGGIGTYYVWLKDDAKHGECRCLEEKEVLVFFRR